MKVRASELRFACMDDLVNYIGAIACRDSDTVYYCKPYNDSNDVIVFHMPETGNAILVIVGGKFSVQHGIDTEDVEVVNFLSSGGTQFNAFPFTLSELLDAMVPYLTQINESYGERKIKTIRNMYKSEALRHIRVE